MQRLATVIFTLLAMVFLTVQVSARPAASPQKLFLVPFTHVAQNEELSLLLAEFARVEGYSALVSPALKGPVTGSFEAIDPYAFLASMGAAYQVRWFKQGRTINFYAQQEIQQAFLAPSIISAETLLALFREADMLSPQLKHKLLRNKNILYVQAPGYYVDQLRQAMASMEQAQVNRVTMRVFPLKNAWAEDKQFNSSNDSRVTVPGVATILRAMVDGGQQTDSTVSRASAAQPGLLGSGLAAGKKSGGEAQSESVGPGRQQSRNQTNVSIMADSRMNAVVVTDAEYRMPYYARVIADLDKPVRLVEIHAAIVDIDSNYQRDLGINFQGAADLGNGWMLGGSAGASSVEGT